MTAVMQRFSRSGKMFIALELTLEAHAQEGCYIYLSASFGSDVMTDLETAKGLQLLVFCWIRDAPLGTIIIVRALQCEIHCLA